MERVAILGAGSWGTALALVLADNGHDVRLWSHRQDQATEINETHKNEKYLPGIELSERIVATTSLAEATKDAPYIVIAVPTKAIREVLQQLKPILAHAVTFVNVSKGIEPDSLKRISEVIAEEIDETLGHDIVILSGPSHAEEVSLRHPTTVTSSSLSLAAAERVQDLFMNQHFRVYTNSDMLGVEIGGALKNIIAIAAGITDGLGYGDNAKAALITRGLTEIARLGTRLGANPLTFAGLTGVGDLIVTCTSVHSRNWRAGHMLGQGKTLQDVLDNMGMVVEGVRTTKAAYQLAQKYETSMPITEALYNVLFEGKTAKEALDLLMNRVKTHEMEDLASIITPQS